MRKIQKLQREKLEILEKSKKEAEKLVEERTVELRRKYIELEVIEDLTRKLGISLDLQTVMRHVVEAIRKFSSDVTISYVIVPFESTTAPNSIYVHTEVPIGDKYLSVVRENILVGLEKLIAGDSKDFLRPWLEREFNIEVVEGNKDPRVGDVPKSYVSIPIIATKGIIGFFDISSLKTHVFTQEKLAIVNTIINSVAQTVERLRALIEGEVYKTKAEFSSIFSHQLLSPLTAARLVLEDFMSGLLGSLNKEQKETLRDVIQRLERLQRIVNDLLQVSRAETGSLQIKSGVVDIENSIEKILKESELLVQAKECKFVFKKPQRKIPKITIDPILFHHVIYNLIANSIRYSPGDRCDIIITLEASDIKEFTISVKDKGIGIRKEDQSKVFEKFFRTEGALQMEKEGTGLGLYAVKIIVEMLGGKVWFESPTFVEKTPSDAKALAGKPAGKEEGRGTTFYITLPIKGVTQKK